MAETTTTLFEQQPVSTSIWFKMKCNNNVSRGKQTVESRGDIYQIIIDDQNTNKTTFRHSAVNCNFDNSTITSSFLSKLHHSLTAISWCLRFHLVGTTYLNVVTIMITKSVKFIYKNREVIFHN